MGFNSGFKGLRKKLPIYAFLDKAAFVWHL